MQAINSDASVTNDYPEALDENAFAALMMGEDNDGDPGEGDDASKKKPSKKITPTEETEQDDDADADADEDSEETPETDDEEAEGDEDQKDEDGEDEKPAKKFTEDDGVYTKVKIGDEEHEVSIKDLKRLYGQEASLTRKSQEVTAEREALATKRAENIAAYDILAKRTTERAQQYRDLPWTQLMKDPNVPADQLQALQAEAAKAFEEETFLKTELGNFMQTVTKEQEAARRTAAQDCLKAITNPENPAHIKGWNDALYNDIRTFGASMGIPAETVNALTDAGAIKVLHMAMQFQRGKSKVVVTQKVNKTPTKIVKNSASSPATRGTPVQVTAKSAVTKAKKSGSMQDAANAFEALMGDD